MEWEGLKREEGTREEPYPAPNHENKVVFEEGRGVMNDDTNHTLTHDVAQG